MPPAAAFRVLPYVLPLVSHPASKISLYPHQVAVWDRWDQDATTLLAAKTGTGKTRAVMLPLLAKHEWGLAVYPTNELIRDQVRAVEKLAAQEGIDVVTWLPGTEKLKYSGADALLLPVDGDLLDEWQRVTHCKSRGEALRRILEPDKPKIVFTNPDVLFLILGLKYHAEPLESLRRYQTLVLDEFHLYQGVELAHALMMISLARGLGFFRRVMLLSATPNPDVREILDRVFSPAVIELGAIKETILYRVAVHAVEVTPVPLPGTDPVDTLRSLLGELKSELQQLRLAFPVDEYIPAVVIVNSVVNAIRLEDQLVTAGFERKSLAIIRGLTNRAIRSTKGKLLAIGTSAIEIGVDFHCDYLLFEASEASSFMQRFGRVGRHRQGQAIALVPPNVFTGMNRLPREISRSDFEERVHTWYPSSSSRPWFVTTEYGMVTTRALTERFIAIADEPRVHPQTSSKIRDLIEGILSDHSARLGCPAQYLQAKSMFERCAAGKTKSQWIKAYCDLNRFRTSLPSVRIRDFTEQHRRSEWQLGEYEADILTLLKRGKGIEWNAKLDRLTIKGIGKLRRVHASDIFDDNSRGLHETKDYKQQPILLLYQDGESTAVSDIMAQENHIFAVVRKKDVEADLDWRLPVIETGPYLLAFDGAALLLLEIERRRT